jgi:hypothetical protein
MSSLLSLLDPHRIVRHFCQTLRPPVGYAAPKLSDTHEGEQMGDEAVLVRVRRLADEMESMLTQAGRAWANLADDLAPSWDEVEREMQAKDPTYATSTERAAIQWAQEQCGVDPGFWARNAPTDAEYEALRNIVGGHPAPESEFEAEVMARATVRDSMVGVGEIAPFIQSEREHPAPPASPAFDPRAATESCSHSGCRRKAFAKLTNIEGDHWLSCAEHYEQDLAAQARSDGHEPAWRVPIGPGVVLERWRGGPIGVKVDGELRCYVTAGELARIFEGPVA